jgi:hypothetical protein
MVDKQQFEAKLTEELGNIIMELSEKIPSDDIFQLRKRLNYSFNSLAECIEKTYKQSDEKRIDRIRRKIRAQAYLDECRDYIGLVDKMKYADVTMGISVIENIENVLGGQTLKEASIDPYKNKYIN